MLHKKLTSAVFILLCALCLSGLFSSAIALVLGFLFTLFFGKHFEAFTGKTISYLLKISIVGLGFGMYINETLKTGKEGLVITVFTIATTLVLGFVLTRLLNLKPKLGHLISSGTAICGGSAIAAISAVIKAKPKTISVAMGVVFTLNAIALFVFPSIGHYFNMSQHQFGLWAAVAIHDTSSVVGAALIYGQEALRVATTVKLARTLWIIPIALLTMLFFKADDQKLKIPWFILLFILAILSNSYFNIPTQLTAGITTLAERLLVLTLFLVGSTLAVKDLKETGLKPFILGVSLWVFISVASLIYIIN